MSPLLSIAGTDRSEWLEAASLCIQDRLGSRSTLHLVLGGDDLDAYDEDPYCPEEDDDLVVADDADPPVPQFGGYVLLPERSGRGAMSVVQVDAVDYNVLADDRYVTASLPAGQTLKQIVTALAAYLPGTITLDPAMPDGPVMGIIEWSERRLSDCYTELMTQTGGQYVIRIGPDAVQRILVLGSRAAPFSITDAVPNILDDPAPSVRRLRDQFANRVSMRYGSGQGYHEQDVTTMLGQTTYVTEYPAPNDINTQWPNQLIVDGSPVCPIFWKGTEPPGGAWTWDWETHTLTNETGTPLTAGSVVHVWQTVQYPCTAMAEDVPDQTARGRIIEWFAPPIADVIPKAQAEAIVAGYLAQRLALPREFSATTDEPGLAPGQTIPIQWSRLKIDALTEFLVTSVTYRHIAGGEGTWAFTTVEGNVYLGSFLDTYRAWSGGGSGSGGTGAGSVVITAVGTFSPIHLGGTRNAPVAPSPADWVPVTNWIPFLADATFTGQVRVDVWARNAGITVTARLRNVTDALDWESDPVTSQSPTEKVIAGIPIVAGKRYRLEVLNSAAGEAVYAIGQLEHA